jgi:transposase-like protein
MPLKCTGLSFCKNGRLNELKSRFNKPHVSKYLMDCKYCSKPCNKCGKQGNGKQKYRCKRCLKYQQDDYQKHAYNIGIKDQIIPPLALTCALQ